MTRKELIEAIARAMAECEPRSLYGDAVAALSAIEAAGVRLVPVEATMEMTHAVWTTDLPRPDMHGDYADLDVQLAARDIYRAMIAASPYAPPGG